MSINRVHTLGDTDVLTLEAHSQPWIPTDMTSESFTQEQPPTPYFEVNVSKVTLGRKKKRKKNALFQPQREFHTHTVASREALRASV